MKELAALVTVEALARIAGRIPFYPTDAERIAMMRVAKCACDDPEVRSNVGYCVRCEAGVCEVRSQFQILLLLASLLLYISALSLGLD